MRLRGGDRCVDRVLGCLDSGQLGSYADSVLCGEISLSLQKVYVCSSLRNKMENEGS